MNYRLCIFLILLTTICNAQEQKKDTIKQLEEIILDAPTITSKNLSITNTSQLHKSTLNSLSPIDIAGKLNQIPGVFLLDGAINTNRITIRGIGSRTPYGTNKLRLYLDNIPLTNGTGSSSIASIDLEDLYRITVVKGPKATAFGANLGGAILVNDHTTGQTNNSIHNSLTVGSYRLFKNHFNVNHHTKNSKIRLTYGLMNKAGYRINSEFDRQTLGINYTHFLKNEDKLTFRLHQVNYTAHIPSSLNLVDFKTNPRQAAFTWGAAKGYEKNRYSLLGVNVEHKFNPQQSINTSVFYTYLDHYEPRPFNILEEFTHGYGLRSVYANEVKLRNKKLNYTLGAELYEDRYAWRTFENLYQDQFGLGSVEGEQLSEQVEHRKQYTLFTTMTYTLSPKLQVMLGLNFNKTNYSFRDVFLGNLENKSVSRNFNGILSPSFSITYRSSQNFQWHANVSRGFSNPGLEETLNPDGKVNTEIEQEKGMNYEVGFSSYWFNNHLEFQMNIYQMNIDNLLVAQRIGDDQYFGKNAGKTRRRGLEVVVKYHGKLSRQWQILPQISYDLSNHIFIDFIDLDNDYNGNPLTGVPKNRFNLNLSISHKTGWTFNIDQQYVGEIPLNDGNTISSNDYSIVKAKIGLKTQIFNRFTGHFHIGINNVFNTNYASSVLINAVSFGTSTPRYYYPGEGRNLYGGIQMNYQL
ncbi:TonB-dependent receptor [Flavobacteriaceae bacterium F08102]|nr:TonB-dependent receptor [Flavobacteriaceae bacterium F08102]